MSEFKLRLSEEEARAVVAGQLRAQLENGVFLEHTELWDDSLNGVPTVSLLGSVGPFKYSWPACLCGVKMKLRAVPV